MVSTPGRKRGGGDGIELTEEGQQQKEVLTAGIELSSPKAQALRQVL